MAVMFLWVPVVIVQAAIVEPPTLVGLVCVVVFVLGWTILWGWSIVYAVLGLLRPPAVGSPVAPVNDPRDGVSFYGKGIPVGDDGAWRLQPGRYNDSPACCLSFIGVGLLLSVVVVVGFEKAWTYLVHGDGTGNLIAAMVMAGLGVITIIARALYMRGRLKNSTVIIDHQPVKPGEIFDVTISLSANRTAEDFLYTAVLYEGRRNAGSIHYRDVRTLDPITATSVDESVQQLTFHLPVDALPVSGVPDQWSGWAVFVRSKEQPQVCEYWAFAVQV